jgi:hypothetical protein
MIPGSNNDQSITDKNESLASSETIAARESIRTFVNRGGKFSREFLGTFGSPLRAKGIATASAVVFLFALTMRFFYFQDHINRPPKFDSLIPPGGVYISEARRITKQGLLPGKSEPETYAKHLLHPPGYLLYLIGVFKLTSWNDRGAVKAIEVVIDSLSAVVVALLAAAITNVGIGVITGLLISISPHLGYSCVYLSPESMFVLPVALAMCSLYLATRGDRERLTFFIVAGLFLGIACWLRANALAMSPFFALLCWLSSRKRRKALKGVLAMVLTTCIVIAPITIRNYLLTGRFIPLTVGLGVVFMQSVSDYDFDKKYGLPKLDPEVAADEAHLYNRPDYAQSYLRPDGIARDHARIGRTAKVILSHPVYYLSTVVRRLDFMLRYDLPRGPDDWPFNTAKPTHVSKFALYAHGTPDNSTGEVVWSMDAAELSEVVEGKRSSGQHDGGGGMSGPRIEFPAHSKDDAPRRVLSSIAVEKRTDYVLRLEAATHQGFPICLVEDGQTAKPLQSVRLPSAETQAPASVYLPFASSNSSKVNVVLIPDGSGETSFSLAGLDLRRCGPTPWSRLDPARWVLRGLQLNVYRTPLMRVLLIVGLVTLALARRLREILLLAAVPLYYLVFQSLLHTEYRYTLPMQHFLFFFAAVSLYLFWRLVGRFSSRSLPSSAADSVSR